MTRSHPNVAVFPPLLPLAGFSIGLGLEQVRSSHLAMSPATLNLLRVIGVVVLCMGAAGFASMVFTMKRARTPIHTSKTPTALVETGPFRFTRNPMYLFGAVAYAGISLVLGILWPLALLPFVQLATHFLVVRREEAFLHHVFGDSYASYCSRVRRWI
jgi:protein-S-isoprenylcysteine O-methyltransferase Ste14